MAVASDLPPQVPGVLDWRARAACRGADVELFFNPDRERGGRKRRREVKAKAICATCPVVASCLDWALRVGEPYGVWGGLSAEERLLLRHRTIGRHTPDRHTPDGPAPDRGVRPRPRRAGAADKPLRPTASR